MHFKYPSNLELSIQGHTDVTSQFASAYFLRHNIFSSSDNSKKKKNKSRSGLNARAYPTKSRSVELGNQTRCQSYLRFKHIEQFAILHHILHFLSVFILYLISDFIFTVIITYLYFGLISFVRM